MGYLKKGMAPPSNGVGTVEGKFAHPMKPLSSLVTNEPRPELEELPLLSYGQVLIPKKSEDFAVAKTNCQRMAGDGSSTYAAFAIFDGHNGAEAAIYSKDNLLNDVMSSIPHGLTRDEWSRALPRAMVAGFVKTDKEWQQKGQTSGTTATLVIVDGWTVTAACVGDSRCVLDAQGTVTALTIDHRLDTNAEECERIKACGGQVAKLTVSGGVEVGPLRVWPGGLCLSRSIGDMDVGEYIVPVPHVKQIKLSPAGGRLIMATDGVWDAVTSHKASRCCRGVPEPEIAAKYIVKEALRIRGLRDDTTCLVIDIVPPTQIFAPAVKKKSSIMKFLGCAHPQDMHLANGDSVMEELFEETSATLDERLGPEASVHAGIGFLLCAICNCSLESDVCISVHAGSFFSQSKACEGPFLCLTCKQEKDAIEEKNSSHP